MKCCRLSVSSHAIIGGRCMLQSEAVCPVITAYYSYTLGKEDRPIKVAEAKHEILRIMVGTGLSRNNIRNYSFNDLDHVLRTISLEELSDFTCRTEVIKEAQKWVERIRRQWHFSSKKEIRRCLPMIMASMLVHGNRWDYDHRYLPEPFNSGQGRRQVDSWLDTDDEYHQILLDTYRSIKWKGD